MAPLPPESTPRYRIHYTTVGEQHTLQVRSNASPANIGIIMDAFLASLGSAIYTWTWDSTEWAPDNSNIFNVVTTGKEGTGYGAGVGSIGVVPFAYTFLARSPGGRRLRMSIYGAVGVGANYRYSAGEDVTIDAAIAVLVFNRADFLCIDNLVPVWYTYVDVQVNDHWIKVIR